MYLSLLLKKLIDILFVRFQLHYNNSFLQFQMLKKTKQIDACN